MYRLKIDWLDFVIWPLYIGIKVLIWCLFVPFWIYVKVKRIPVNENTVNKGF